MEIIPLRAELHLIKPAFGQTYLWRDGSELTLVDTGIPGSGPDLAAAFAELGFRRADLRRIVLTHCHEDHAGSAAEVRGWGEVEVLAHRLDAPVVRGERPRAEPVLTEPERALAEQFAGFPSVPPCPVDTELDDGDTIGFGGGAQVIGTPGHTDGSIAIRLPAHGVLFTGDLVANSAEGPLLGPFNTDRARARESFVRLAQVPAELVCFGHGDPLIGAEGAAAWRALGERCQGGPDAVPDPLG
ncbi:MBL fold metallo-hydrolase [Amycolatopsis anabasis]|uniref:MBL fold metallo-hydrolase n=1 Tax=Amycolatopsis anabasis TaxID=1840409 RepID=UPI00131A9070|nr:MBL fold metallo-hydrolase [Amycolatopsis anabasis]